MAPVTAQAFPEALRLTTAREPSHLSGYGTTAPLTAAVRKGDVAWVSLWDAN
ncbi:MAG: hypothetical protein H7Z41_04060 [Cytophagales bacterium]|nr:hypothetical protein [Armatimonadota bacterium]